MLSDGGPSLRNRLKAATAQLHSELDRTMAPLAFGNGEDYGRFLSIQYAARAPIETWIAEQNHDEAPPAQLPLIIADLDELRVEPPRSASVFGMPDRAEPLGLFWLLAGSSFGNRTILSKRAERGSREATRFLSGTAMTEYWKSVRPAMNARVSDDFAERATLAAVAGFRHFLAQVAAFGQKAAA